MVLVEFEAGPGGPGTYFIKAHDDDMRPIILCKIAWFYSTVDDCGFDFARDEDKKCIKAFSVLNDDIHNELLHVDVIHAQVLAKHACRFGLDAGGCTVDRKEGKIIHSAAEPDKAGRLVLYVDIFDAEAGFRPATTVVIPPPSSSLHHI